jgi:WD40 repeat protein
MLERSWERGFYSMSVLKNHTAAVCCLSVSRGGQRMISGGVDTRLLYWDLQYVYIEKKNVFVSNKLLFYREQKFLKSYKGHTGTIRSVFFDERDGVLIRSAHFYCISFFKYLF